jgi:hypothetical protein
VTNTSANFADTAQAAAEQVASAVGALRSNETVSAAIDKASTVYREHPLLSKIGVAVVVAGVASLITKSARR